MKFKMLPGNFDPRTAFLHPFRCGATVLRNQTTDITNAFALGDDSGL